jgi:hypothetical protein
MVQVVPVGPSTPSFPVPVEVTLPVVVIVSGLSVGASTTGPVTLVLMVRPLGESGVMAPVAARGDDTGAISVGCPGGGGG